MRSQSGAVQEEVEDLHVPRLEWNELKGQSQARKVTNDGSFVVAQ